MKGLAITVAAIGVGAGTWFVLEKTAPYVEEKPTVAETVSVDEVFSKSLTETPVAAAPAAEPVTAAEPETAPTPETELAEAAPAAPVEAEPMPEDSAAAEPAPAEPAPEASAAAAEPAPVAEPTPAPAAEPTPVAAAPTPAPAPVAKPAAPKSSPSSKPSKPAAVKAWWGSERADRLSLIYAGSAAYKKAVVLMFNGAFDTADAARKNLQVLDAAGKAVAGSWEIGANNKRMLLFPVPKSGTYKVVVKKALADRQGRTMQSDLSGPVVVE